MRILFTGATGVLGCRAVPKLTAAGHDVTAVHRADADRARLEAQGAAAARVDLFDPGAVDRAVAGHAAVIHFATAIPPADKMSDRSAWEANDRLRNEATANLVAAALRHDVDAFIQQSVTFLYADGGDRWLDEASPTDPAAVVASAFAAERRVARFGAEGGRGVVLRLSRLYGPGEASADLVRSVSRRETPIIGDGGNYVSSLHGEDGATALVAALGAPAGFYNVTDDDPVTSRAYLEESR